MSKIGTMALELQGRANEMGFETIDECIAAGYTPDLTTGTWATPEDDFHNEYVQKAQAIYEKMNREFETEKAMRKNDFQDCDYYKLAMMYEIKEMIGNMDAGDREILDKLAQCEHPLTVAYDAWIHYDEEPSLWEQLQEAMRCER